MTIDINEFRLPPRPTTPPGRPAKRKILRDPHARVLVAWLVNPRWWRVFPPVVRLYLYLWYETFEGTRPVTLTNVMTARIGLDRRRKSQYLRQLEDLGLLVVIQQGKANPVIDVNPSPIVL